MRLGERWAVYGDLRGGHVHVKVRHGTPGQRALLGDLCMDLDEWRAFASLLEQAGACVTYTADDAPGVTPKDGG